MIPDDLFVQTSFLFSHPLCSIHASHIHPSPRRDGLKSFGPSARYLRMFALLEKKLKNLETASRLLRESCALDPNDVRSWLNFAIIERRCGRLNEARKALQRAVGVMPENPDLYIAWARIELDLGELDEARKVYAEGLARCSKGLSGALYTEYALLESGSANYERAREIFKEGASKAKHHAPLFAAWAQMEGALRNEEEAKRLEERYLRLTTKAQAKQERRSKAK